MKIKEYKLISKEENGTFPQLKCIAEYEIDDSYYSFYDSDKYEFIYYFFGNVLKLQEDYVESLYVMSFNEEKEVVGYMKLSTGGRGNTDVPYDSLFTYLLLTGSDSFIMIHNHPNNDSQKSEEDLDFENDIKKIVGILNINFIDSLIITKSLLKEAYDNMEQYLVNIGLTCD